MMQTTKSEQKNEEPTLRRQVYDAIVVLSDPVSTDVLQSKLYLLDVQSWLEVVEERHLGHLCGFPTCPKKVQVELKQKYVINRQKKKIYDCSAEEFKFCSEECFSRHQHILDQVANEPIWLTGDRPPTNFSLDPLPKSSIEASKEKKNVEAEDDPITASLISRITSLKIADNQHEPDSSEDEEGETEEETQTALSRDEREEIEIDRSTSKEPKIASPSSDPKIVSTPPPRSSKKLSESNDGKSATPEEKLARLKAKYPVNKKPTSKAVTPLVRLIEAKPAPTSEAGNTKTVVSSDFAHFERVLNEWLTPAAVKYLKSGQVEDDDNCGGRIDEDGIIVDEVPKKRELTDVDQAVINFYRGDRVAIKAPEDEAVQESSREIILPPVDCYNVMVRRREILMEQLHTGWQQLHRALKFESKGVTGALKKLVGTFHLTADNLDLSPVEWKLASAVFFRLVYEKDDQPRTVVFTDGTPSEAFASYLRTINCNQQSFVDICSRVLEKIK